MIGDGMLGSSSDVNQGTTVGGQRTDRGQSPRSSKEAGNDRGAKEGRDVVLGRSGIPSHKGPCSAARLIARMQGQNLPGTRRQPNSEPPATQVSGAQACAAGATLPKALSRVPEPVHQRPRTGKPDAGEPPVRFGWRATARAVLYPHCRLSLRDRTAKLYRFGYNRPAPEPLAADVLTKIFMSSGVPVSGAFGFEPLNWGTSGARPKFPLGSWKSENLQ